MPEPSARVPASINKKRLFVGICCSLVPTAASFAIIGDILGPLKADFILTNYEVGLIGGAALWGMAISQILFGSLADLGMRLLTRIAFVFHLTGTATMISASGFAGEPFAFWILFFGAIIIALGNGLIEVVGNPLVAALYPDQKTTRLNLFHAWFPGGMVIAGLASYGLSLTGLGTWEMRLALVFIPILLYGVLILREPFPPTEGVAAGVSIKNMFHATFTSPLFILMFFCMMITASIELGPMRWIPSVLESGGIPGILVLVWISGMMAVLRLYAGPFVERLSPTGLLLFGAVTSGTGLYLFSFAETGVMAFLFATIFAVGVAFFWPTMLGFVNERIPKSGALGMGLMGGIGMTAAGLIAIPMMGNIADEYVPERLPNQETVALLEQTTETFPALMSGVNPSRHDDVTSAINLSEEVLAYYRSEGELPGDETANALRAITSSGVQHNVVSEAAELLGPAENYGGRLSFRYVAPFAIVITLVFGVLYWRDRRAGGYRAKSISEPEQEQTKSEPLL